VAARHPGWASLRTTEEGPQQIIWARGSPFIRIVMPCVALIKMVRRIRLLRFRFGLVNVEKQRCWRDISAITRRLAPTLAKNDSRTRRQLSGW